MIHRLIVVFSLLVIAPMHPAFAFDYNGWDASARKLIEKGEPIDLVVRRSLILELSLNASSADDISRLRNDDVVGRVLWDVIRLSDTSDDITRKAGSLIIVNVLDNTTVCVVVSYLDDGFESSRWGHAGGGDLRFLSNLLRAIELIAGYQYSNNVIKIKTLLDKAKKAEINMEERIRNIDNRLDKSTNAAFPMPKELEAASLNRCKLAHVDQLRSPAK